MMVAVGYAALPTLLNRDGSYRVGTGLSPR